MTNSDQESRIMPVQRLGWGFLLAWVFCTFYTDIAADALGGARMDAVLDPWARVVGSTLPVLVAVAVLVALVAGERRWGPLVLRRGAAAASSSAAAVGTPLLFSSAPADLSQMAPFVFGALLTGGGSACLWVLWGACYARLPQEEVERCAPVSAVLAALLILAASAMSGWVAVVFVSLLPVVSAACALVSWRELDSVPLPYESAAGDARLHPQAAAIPRPTDALRAMGRSGWGILIACLFVCVEGGFYGGNRSSSLELQAIIVASALFMVGIGLYSVAGPRRVSVAYLFRWMCPLLVAGFAALVVAGASQAGAFAAFGVSLAARFAFCVITQMFFARFAARGVATPTQSYGLGWIFVHLGDLLGVVALDALDGPLAAGAVTVAQVAAVATVLLVASTMFVLDDDASFAGPADDGRTETDADASAAEGPTPAASPFDDRVAQIARSIGLTPRETEVFVLLMHGRSVPYIRDELVISRDTVATHVKHIYAKAGVHSRQELLDLAQDGD